MESSESVNLNQKADTLVKNNSMNCDNEERLGEFFFRHIGLSNKDIKEMVSLLGFSSLDDFIDSAVPKVIKTKKELMLNDPHTESEGIAELKKLATKNQLFRSYLGMGYHNTITPNVIARNILQNPSWYTQYTPYQAEISQGRLEALLNFQTMVADLTGLPIANASLLDEATAAAEAMAMSLLVSKKVDCKKYFVSKNCLPQTIAVVKNRAEAIGVEIVVGEVPASVDGYFGVLLQYPATNGEVIDYRELIQKAQKNQVIVTMAADILSLALIVPPGELGADIAVGSTQRFGVPLGFGGPHAAYFSTKDEYKRQIPGRIVGVSHDSSGRRALRLALQTREQHIRREKATSNICTAQVLLAIMASMYAVYHGSAGIRKIAERVHSYALLLAQTLKNSGYKVVNNSVFDTVTIAVTQLEKERIVALAEKKKINLCAFFKDSIQISIDETVTKKNFLDILDIFSTSVKAVSASVINANYSIPENLKRRSPVLSNEIFNKFHTETELMRYIKSLELKDLSLTHSMIPLGSCTMKLNAASEMQAVTWDEFSQMHPFAPAGQTKGYNLLFNDLEKALCKITGFSKVSLQPNAGSQGEYAGLLTIRQYLKSIGAVNRNICLIPKSAHGTNPATAVMAGFKVVPVDCDQLGNIDLKDLEIKINEHSQNLGCLMVTYPSTHGVFEEGIKKVTSMVHKAGGQVYMDGANLNALVGICRPADIGMDVCHINLHKTFCIPHGGGGPGMGPIAVAKHLAPFLPSHPVVRVGGEKESGPVSAAPWGSSLILTIPWMYIKMMGGYGLTEATKIGILNANYIAKRLNEYFPVLFRGKKGYVAHECIVDLRKYKEFGVEVEDVAKRLMDYGFHAPTVSFPVSGTLMIEPTESESKKELDKFCDAMISIHGEIMEIKAGQADAVNNVLKKAPHTLADISNDIWDRPYSREKAGFPLPWCRERKFWPTVGRIDSAFGDKNLVCTCGGVEDYT